MLKQCRVLLKNILMIFIFLWLPQAYADENFKFANIICSPEMGFFEIRAVNIEDFYDIQPNGVNQKLVDDLAKKYSFYYGDIEKICKLKQDVFWIKLTYAPVRDRGMCGAEQPGTLTIKMNGNILIDHVPFNAACNDINVTNISYKIYDQFTGNFITTCGKTQADFGIKYNGFCLNSSLKQNKKLVINREYLENKLFKKQ